MPTEPPAGVTLETYAELVQRWDAALPNTEPTGEMLIKRYAEPHRHYHGVDHLLHVLRRIDEFGGDEHDLYLVRLAAWFHDSVYDVPERELTNEEASARMARRELARAGLEQEDLNAVTRLIKITTTHQPGQRDPDGELIVDADLAILAAAPEDYDRYVHAVREEYRHVPDEQFIPARYRIMSNLGRGEIFYTSKGRRLTKAARKNVNRELGELEEWLDDHGFEVRK